MSPVDKMAPRAVPLQVLHLAMPRTGSVSMKAAYEMLDLPTYHGFVFIEHPQHQIQWEKAVNAKFKGMGKPFGRAEYDAFLGDYAVLSDLPVIGFWEDLVRAYPEAKVVLVERDVEKWERSYLAGVVPSNFTWLAILMRWVIEPCIPFRPATLIWDLQQAYFHCHDRDSYAANIKSVYLDHYAQVRKTIPPERLLEYRLGDGWEPLCRFLGKPVPDAEFPHLNESKEFAIWMRDMQRRKFAEGLALLGRYVLPAVAIGLGIWWIQRSSTRY